MHNYTSASAYAVRGSTDDDPNEWVGRSLTVDAPFPVEAGRVADYCALLADPNPVYWDHAAATARFGAPVAPPGTLMCWRFGAPWQPGGRPAHGPLIGLEVPLPVDDLINVSTVTEFYAPLFIGTRLTFVDTVVSIAGPKKTGLGEGYFVTTEFDAIDDSGTKVATNRNVMLRFTPNGEESPSPAPPAPLDGANLPELIFPVTQTLCALDVAATKDYFPGHHDSDFARSQGIPDAYPNTMFYQGLTDRVALEWGGAEATIHRRSMTMASPAPIGKTLRTRGVETRRDGGTAEVLVEVVTEEALIARAEITLNGLR
jgi:acyl dehydratase